MKNIKFAAAIIALVPMLVACSPSSQEEIALKPTTITNASAQEIIKPETHTTPVAHKAIDKYETNSKDFKSIMSIKECLIDEKWLVPVSEMSAADRAKYKADMKEISFMKKIAAGASIPTQRKKDGLTKLDAQRYIAMFDLWTKNCKK